MTHDITLMGFGEAGQAFATGLRPRGLQIAAYDKKLEDPECRDACLKTMEKLEVTPREPVDLSAATLVLCVVTADQALEAALTAAQHLRPGAWWFDGNSCSPGTKRQAAQVIFGAGARYVDLAIMAPVHPRLHRTPMLASGHDAETGAALLTKFGMQSTVAGPEVGQASTIKMLRSVIIKGFEALTAEAMLAARAAGVEAAVLGSLQASDPGLDWEQRSAYNLERMLVHGARRASEMKEVAATLRELGLPDRMAQATSAWQASLAALDLDPGPDSLGARADQILQALR